MTARLFFFGIIISFQLLVCTCGFGATHSLTISTNGNGTVGRNPTNSVYPNGAVVTLTALPSTNWLFTGWSGSIAGELNPTNVLMDADKVITANFVQIPIYTLTVNVTGAGSVNLPGGIFLSNTIVSITATTSNGWVFQRWTGDASEGANPLNVLMSSNKVITAVFAQPNCLSDLVAWLQFEGSGNSTLVSNNAVLLGNPVFTNGVIGQGFHLDGANDSAQIPASPALNVGLGKGFTVALWVRPDDVSSLQPIVEWNTGNGGIGVHLWLSVDMAVPGDGVGGLFANLLDNAGTAHQFWTDSNLLSVGVYHHVALTYDTLSGIATIYHNGVIARQTNLGSFTSSTAMNLDLGVRTSGSFAGLRFRGDMDQFILYNRAVSPADVQAIYAGGLAIECPPKIIEQPQSVFAAVGDPATFAVGAVGAEPLNYQWYFNSQWLIGQTNHSLVLSNVQSNQDGFYAIVVSNAFGVVTSDTAQLVLSGSCGSNALRSCTEAALRQAIAIGGEVRFCCNGTITLTNTIDVTNGVILDASGASVILNGGNAVRLFNVSTGISLTISNVMLVNGLSLGTNGASAGVSPVQDGESVTGGAIYNAGGTVRLVSCVLSNNGAHGGDGGSGNSSAKANGAAGHAAGGAIFNAGGILILQHSLLVNNASRGGNGGSYADGTTASPYGMGGSASGGAVCNDGGAVTVIGSIFRSNVAFAAAGAVAPRPIGRGGALFQSSGSCDLSNTTFIFNIAQGAAAGGSGTYSFNNGASAAGGAIGAMGGAVVVRHASFQTNSALGGSAFRFSGLGEAFGGALFNSAEAKIIDSHFSGNAAQPGAGGSGRGPASGWGGAILNAFALEVTGTLLASNVVYGSSGCSGTAAFGGAVCNVSAASFHATNCTFTLNRAIGGVPCNLGVSAGGAYGGAIYNEGTLFSLVNGAIASNAVSVTPNSFRGGPAAGANIANTNGTLLLRNSLLAYPGTNANVWGTITDGGYNMSSDGSANFSSGSSFNFTDPKLLPLANNGGPTLTMALAPDSPALDWAPAADAPATDQRGVTRPFDSGVDIGAFEASPFFVPLAGRRSGDVLSLSFDGVAGLSYRIEHSGDLQNWNLQEATGVLATNGVVLRTIPLTGPKQFFRLSLDL